MDSVLVVMGKPPVVIVLELVLVPVSRVGEVSGSMYGGNSCVSDFT